MKQSRLHAVQQGTLNVHHRFAFAGCEGVGKSSLAAHAPNPIFFDLEDGTSQLSVARYSFRDGAGGHVAKSYTEILDALTDLRANDHSYETLVIDTVDRLESLIWRYILERDSGKVSAVNRGGKRLHSIESYGYGKGFQIAVDEWRGFCSDLDTLRLTRNMHIVLLCHDMIRTFKNPEGDDYDRYHLRLDAKAAGFIKEWCDVVGWCTFEEGAAKLDPDQPKAKGYSTGRRLVHFVRTAAYDAKSRIPLPPELELTLDDPWRPLAAALDVGLNLSASQISELIALECMRLSDNALTNKVNIAVEQASGNTATLSRYLNDLKQRDPQPKEEVLNG